MTAIMWHREWLVDQFHPRVSRQGIAPLLPSKWFHLTFITLVWVILSVQSSYNLTTFFSLLFSYSCHRPAVCLAIWFDGDLPCRHWHYCKILFGFVCCFLIRITTNTAYIAQCASMSRSVLHMHGTLLSAGQSIENKFLECQESTVSSIVVN